MSDAFNVDVTQLDPDQSSPNVTNIQAYLQRVHAWPRVWYASSITPLFSAYGFPLSIEGGQPTFLSQTFFPGRLCVLQTDTGSCPQGPKSAPVYTLSNPFIALFNASNNSAIEVSPTGEVTFPNSFTATLTPHSPVWFVMHATTTAPENVLSFDYAFLPVAGSQDILAVFVDDNLVYKVDERLTDSGPHTVTNIPVGDLAPGPHTIEFRLDPFTDAKSSIQISNIQLGILTQTQITDTTAPTTMASVSGPAGINGWYIGTTTVTLSAADNTGGVGVQNTLYSLDGGPLQTYTTTSSIVIGSDGAHSLQYYSLDNFNNQEATSTLIVKIDKVAPEALITVSTSTKDFLITGIDNLSSTTITKTATSTTVTDQAGNTLTLNFQKTFTGNLLTLAKLTSIKYGTSTPISLPTQFVYIWNPLTNPPTLLSQTVIVDNNYVIEAAYDKSKNKTTIIVKKKGTPIQTISVSGLCIIKLTSSKGTLNYSW